MVMNRYDGWEENECWVDLRRFPNHQISTYGRVRFKNTGRILKGYINKDGYRVVQLTHDNKGVQLVHRLMAETFFGDPLPEQTQVNHIDCHRSNNHFLNVHWCTPAENVQWAVDHGTLDYQTGLNRAMEVNRKPVKIVETGQVFASLQDCADYLGVTRGNISRILSGERKGQKIHGYHVEYVREEDM